jgi:hypothetical protein
MNLETEGAGPPPAASLPSFARPGAWDFHWVDQAVPEPSAHLTGMLRWRGFDVGFAIDGLLGIDGRLAAPSLATLEPHLQQLVLHHFADECLRTFAAGPLAGVELTSAHWHEEPLPMQGEFEFTVRRPGARGVSRGRLTVFGEDGRGPLMDALASLRWPLPAPLRQVAGRLHVGSAYLMPDELAGIDLGDLVWIDDAELSPSGLRVHCRADGGASQAAWVKRGVMTRDALQQPAAGGIQGDGGRADAGDGGAAPQAAATALAVKSAALPVARSWLQGAEAVQRLPQPALAMVWEAWQGGRAVFEGRLAVVGRRLGLRVTRVMPGPAQERNG